MVESGAKPSGQPSEVIVDRRQVQVQYFTEPAIETSTGQLPMEMILIPGGQFLMGSPETELDRTSFEDPQHLVKLPPFFMGKYPVTQAHWRAVATLPQVDIKLNRNPSDFKGDNRPVENVSWHEAVEFCRRLAQHTERSYRLPSEAEWEYACRAGTATPFHFGETITTEYANYRGTDYEELKFSGSYSKGPKGKYRQQITEVNAFGIANDFGLMDMHGNIYEWCQDHWHDSYEGAPSDGSAWVDKDTIEDKNRSQIIRGGSWIGPPRYCRSAYRSVCTPGARDSGIGLRVVLSAPIALHWHA